MDKGSNFWLRRTAFERQAQKVVAFSGAAGNGAIGTVALFTVTGAVAVCVVARCTEDLVGAATLEVGIAGNTAALVAQLADATTLDTGEVYVDGTPATVEALPGFKVIGNGQDIILTVGSANVTDGTVEFDVLWKKLSSDGNLVAA